RRKNLYLGAGLDVDDQRVDVVGTRLSKDRLRVIHMNGVYDFTDDLRGLSTIRLGLRQGLSILGASQEGDQKLSRQGGDPQFTSVNIFGSRYQPLIHQFGLYLSAAGQY